MKISNILLTGALLYFLGCLLAFDFGIKARYNKGNFKNPESEFIPLNFRDFDSVQVNASTMANVKFVQGPFKVRVFEDRADIVKVTQKGRLLNIDVDFKGDNYEDSPFVLIISCPVIKLLVTDNKYIENGKQKIDSNAIADLVYKNRLVQVAKKVVVEGFNQDSLSIIQNNGSHVRLVNNRLKSISAIVGRSSGSSSFLTIDESNVFNYAYLDIRNRSQLFMAKAIIKNLDYKIAPDAKVTFVGNSSKLFH